MTRAEQENIRRYVLRLGDNTLILGQQVSAWCGHAPVLEEDIALANVALDLIGQATNWLNYAAQLSSEETTADNLAFLRDEREFTNLLLTEQPDKSYAHSIMRQFLFDSWHYPMLKALMMSKDCVISEIATKSSKEVAYHLERSTELVISLGCGTDTSYGLMQDALNDLWRFTGELCEADALDNEILSIGIGPDLIEINNEFQSHIKEVFSLSTLTVPENTPMRLGGKSGIHSEAMGPILTTMQHLQRAYPGVSW
mgnify:CR=1 FL=1